jgi:hypothetical protein
MPSPLARPAFADTNRASDIETKRDDVLIAQTAVRAAVGKSAKKAAHKTLQSARRALSAAVAASDAERAAEKIVPLSQRTEDDYRHARAKVMIDRHGNARGAQIVSPLETMMRWGWPIKVEHVQAANRYERDYELAYSGAFKSPDIGGAPSGSAGSGNASIERRIGAADAYARVSRDIGILGNNLLMHVVIERELLSIWASNRGIKPDVAQGMLIATLARLVEFYQYRISQPER